MDQRLQSLALSKGEMVRTKDSGSSKDGLTFPAGENHLSMKPADVDTEVGAFAQERLCV